MARSPSRARVPVEQLAQYARLVFGEQPARLLLLVAFIRTKMTFAVFDRAGLFVSDSFDVNDNPLLFIRIVSMMFLDREHLGFDPLFDYTPVDGEPSRTITINGETYDVQELLYTQSMIRGRGTVCLSVKPKNREWVDVTGQLREPRILDELNDVPGITRQQNSVDYRTRQDFDRLKKAEKECIQERNNQSARIKTTNRFEWY